MSELNAEIPKRESAHEGRKEPDPEGNRIGLWEIEVREGGRTVKAIVIASESETRDPEGRTT